jgi:DNA polymerase-3 subunit delta
MARSSAPVKPAAEPRPVYALVGNDVFRHLEELARIVALLPADVQRVDVDGETAELIDVTDELRSFSMFGGSKLLVVRSADAFVTRFRERLEAFISEPAPGGTLVLRLSSLPGNQRIHKVIAKVGQIIECEPPRDLGRWVADRARSAHGLRLTADLARLLVEEVGADMGRLDNELAKLALVAPDGHVSERHIRGGVAFQREQEMWELTGALARGDVAEALRRWRGLLQTDPSSEFRAVTWLTMWLEDARAAAAAGRAGQRIDERRFWRYRGPMLDEFLRTVDALGEGGVARTIDRLAEVDRRNKTGVGDAATNVEDFILSLAGQHP